MVIFFRGKKDGPRWKHGGTGKLTTYKSSRDLVDKDTSQPLPASDAQQMNADSTSGMAVNLDLISGNLNQDRLAALKTQVLKKASTKVIRRESWAGAGESSGTDRGRKQDTKVNGVSHVNGVTDAGKKSSGVKSATSLKKKGDIKKPISTDLSYKRKKDISDRSRQASAGNSEVFKNTTHESSKNDQTERVARNESLTINKSTEKDVPNVPTNTTYTPRKITPFMAKKLVNKNKTFITQPQPPPEIFIEPKTGEVKLGPDMGNTGQSMELDGTRVVIARGSVDKSIDGTKLPCSIVDTNIRHNNAVTHDVFGLSDLNNFAESTPNNHRHRFRENVSPFAASKQCNTEVEFWLRGLDIPDVDMCVKIFADNAVDLLDLEFMSASQLHDMGITAIGSLDKILKGIKDLKTQPLKNKDRGLGKSKQLDPSSLKWESDDTLSETARSVLKDKKPDSSRSHVRHHSLSDETFVKRSLETYNNDHLELNLGRSSSQLSNADVNSLRCSSRMSNVSASLDLGSRSRPGTPSFAASTHASSAKCTEKKPPSASKMITKSLSQSTNKLLTQSVNLKTSQNGLRRSNSAVFERSTKKDNLESKPTRGVLIRPRSASLTRVSTKGNQDTVVKKADVKEKKLEPVQEKKSIRRRSRSADAVKRKALEG